VVLKDWTSVSQGLRCKNPVLTLSSDHPSALITLTAYVLNQEKQPSLSNRHTNWDDFRHLINNRVTLNISLKTEEDIEAAVKFFSGQVGTQHQNGHIQGI
jgi:hypothetical protein